MQLRRAVFPQSFHLVRELHQWIEAGDTYQVNYTQRLHFAAFGEPVALYAALRAAQPVPYKTNLLSPTFESLRTRNDEQAFPIMLEPFLCTRFEMAAFARQAHRLGVDYIGVCCGGAPHYVRAMAEALGRTVPASKYSPAMELHPMLGSQVSDKDSHFLTDWKS